MIKYQDKVKQMEELKNRITDLKLLASKFKNNIEESYLFSVEISRLEELLLKKINEINDINLINDFSLNY